MTDRIDEEDEFYTGQIRIDQGPPNGWAPAGYASPPKEHQFRPGQSGNPRGRPKKAKLDGFSPNVLAAIAGLIAKPLTVVKGGKKTTMPAELAIATKFFNHLLSDDPKIQFKALEFMSRSGMGSAVDAIFQRHEEIRIAKELETSGWDDELEKAYQIVEDQFTSDGRSEYEFALAITSCSCSSMDPWRDGEAAVVARFEAAHPEEFPVDGAGADTRASGLDVRSGGPEIQSKGPDVRSDGPDIRPDDGGRI